MDLISTLISKVFHASAVLDSATFERLREDKLDLRFPAMLLTMNKNLVHACVGSSVRFVISLLMTSGNV